MEVDPTNVKEEPTSTTHEEVNIEIKNEAEEFSESNTNNFDQQIDIKEETQIIEHIQPDTEIQTTENIQPLISDHIQPNIIETVSLIQPPENETEAILPINTEDLKNELIITDELKDEFIETDVVKDDFENTDVLKDDFENTGELKDDFENTAELKDELVDTDELKNELIEPDDLKNDLENTVGLKDNFPNKEYNDDIDDTNQSKDDLETADELKTEHNDDEDENMGFVSYDYPNFEDSMDSSEAAALSQVEACLNDDVSIKSEYDDDKETDDKEDNYLQLKEESEETVTETHIITNKLINTSTSATNINPGQTTTTLIMEIHPLTPNENYNKLGNPEEILPTTSRYPECESFQLNSITGNFLSLEQEAYSLLQTKQTKKSEKTIVCPKCPKTFKYKKGYKHHMKIHDEIERRANGILKGLKTKEENRKKRDMEYEKSQDYEYVEIEPKVQVKNEGSYNCTCGQEFRRRSRMETCLRSHTYFTDSYHACSTCDKKFKTKSELIYHRNKFHKRKFACKFCPTDYDTQKALFKHLQAHQKVQLTEYKVVSEIAKGNLELNCLICNQKLATLPEFKTHLLEDHKGPYQCEYCSEITFSKMSIFIEHMKQLHSQKTLEPILSALEAFIKLIKAWKCEECGVQFYKSDELALHQIEHIPELKSDQNYQCPDCNRVFISNQGLHSHRRMHHPKDVAEKVEPENVGVLCLECRKVCKDMPALASHMRLHSMDRKYPCKFCDFRFATPQKRKIHAEIHTGDMKYVCFICEYQCSSENRLKQHKMSLKHLNMKEYLLTGKPLIEEEPVSKKKKSKETKKKDSNAVICDICGEQFADVEAMDEHKKTHPFIEFPNEETPTRIFFK